MNTKKKALKGLLILGCVLLASMYFAQTVQTITTAKVQKVSATRGKLEDRIDVKGEVRFSNSEPFILEDARAMKLTVDQVLAQRGGLIKAGEPLFSLDDTTLRNRLEVAQKSVAVADAELVGGRGAVVRVSGSGSDARIMIRFDDVRVGVKELALTIAPMIRLEE